MSCSTMRMVRAFAMRRDSPGSPAMSSPSKTIRPAVGRSTPVTQLKNVDFPAPFGPMIARTSPRGTATETSLSAVSPPNRTVSRSVRRIAESDVTLGVLAGGRHDRLFLRDDLQDLVLAAADLVEELADERLVILLAEDLVALREVAALLHPEALERADELHRVLASAEARLLDAELEGVHALEVRLDVAIGERPARIDRLQAGHGVV